MSFDGFLEQGTTLTISLGPFVDKDDGNTEKTGLTVEDTDVYLSKNGGAKANPNDTNDCTEDADGVYRKQLDGTDTGTVGRLAVYCHFTDCLYVRQNYIVLDPEAYAGIVTGTAFGTDDKILISTDGQDLSTTLDVNTKAISGSTATADKVESVFLGTGHTDDVDLSARTLKLDSDTDVALEILSSDDSAIKAVSTASGKHGMELAGNVAGDGLSATGGSTGNGIHAVGGGTSGSGIKAEAATSGDGVLAVGATNGHGLNADGAGSGEGISATGGLTGEGIEAIGGGTSGAGIRAAASANNDAGMELVKHGTGIDLDSEISLTHIMDVVLTEGGAGRLAAAFIKLFDVATPVGTVNEMPSDVVKISGDTTAANNLELQYDTTGLAGDTFPATQAQVGAIAGISAAGFPTEAEADNTGGAIKAIAFVGTQTSGTYVSTEAEDGVYHQIDDDTNAIDIVYQFDLRGDRQASEGIFKGYLSGGNDAILVQAYDYVGPDWETRATISGQAGSTNIDRIFTFLSKHTGISGADRGKCLVRFVCSGQSNPTLYVDELLVVGTNLGQSVGYARGAVWIDTSASNTNTVDFVDGVADNPVSTIAAALTIAASVGLVHFEVATGSSITLGANVDGKTFNGRNWTLALGGQSCSDSVFVGATVSGTCTGAAKPRFERCTINAVTLPPSIMLTCGLAGTITIGSAGDFFFVDCVSLIAGASTPVLDFGGALNSSNVSFRDYSGGIEIQNMGAGSGTYNMSLEGDGALIINANCSATSNVALRGNFILTDNAGGAVTVTTDDDTTDINTILVDTNEIQGKLPTNNIMGSSVASDKDDEIDAIKAVTDLLPDAGALNDLATLVGRLTAARAGYLDELAAANIPADVDTLLARLTAARAGYLDELAAANLPADVDTLIGRVTAAVALASVCTEARLAELDAANIPTDLGNIEGDTQNIQSRIPAALVGGRMDSDVGNIQNNVITAASINTDAIDADAIAASAVAEIQTGLATAAALTTHDNKLAPVALDGGAATVGGMLTKMADDNGGADFDAGTDSLQEIRDRGDAAWAGGGAAPTVEQIRTEMDANSTEFAAILTAIGNLDDITVGQIFAGVIDGTVDLQESLTVMLARVAGNVVKTGNSYESKDQAGVTKVTRLIAANSVTSTIA